MIILFNLNVLMIFLIKIKWLILISVTSFSFESFHLKHLHILKSVVSQ